MKLRVEIHNFLLLSFLLLRCARVTCSGCVDAKEQCVDSATHLKQCGLGKGLVVRSASLQSKNVFELARQELRLDKGLCQRRIVPKRALVCITIVLGKKRFRQAVDLTKLFDRVCHRHTDRVLVLVQVGRGNASQLLHLDDLGVKGPESLVQGSHGRFKRRNLGPFELDQVGQRRLQRVDELRDALKQGRI